MMSRSSGSLLLVLALLLCRPTPGQAREDSADRFQDLCQRAVAHYKQGRYQDAIGELREAYAIRQLPRLLLNLGQAYRKLGHAREALHYYESYLKVEQDPRPEIRAEVTEYIATTQALINATGAGDPGAASPGTAELPRSGDAPAGAPAPASAGLPGIGEPGGIARSPSAASEPGATATSAAAPDGGRAAHGPPPVAAVRTVAPIPPGRSRPVYKRAWFWGTLAGIAAAGVAAGVVTGLYYHPATSGATPPPMMGITITPVF